MSGIIGNNFSVSSLGGQYAVPVKSSPDVRQSAADVFERLGVQAGPAYQLELSLQNGTVDENNSEVREMKRTGKIECKTCASRKYQDESGDAGVSFKSAAHIAPENAASIVQSHEQEHIINAQNKSLEDNTKIVSQSVRLFSSVCPECGRSYISGGEASTTTKSKETPSEKLGNNVDLLM